MDPPSAWISPPVTANGSAGKSGSTAITRLTCDLTCPGQEGDIQRHPGRGPSGTVSTRTRAQKRQALGHIGILGFHPPAEEPNSSSLLTTARDASISATSTSMAQPPSHIGRPWAKIPKRPNFTIAVGSEKVLGAIVGIEIFEENHRISQKTPHPSPRTVSGRGQLGRKQPRERRCLRFWVLPYFAVC